jgi:hypothetical protein
MAQSRRRQSPMDQIERLYANGCCPVHGLFMPQVATWYQYPGGAWFTVVECPRQDCAQRAKAYRLPRSNREIFGAKKLHLTIQGVVSSLIKRPFFATPPVSPNTTQTDYMEEIGPLTVRCGRVIRSPLS